jgi:hypothetical protein
MFSSQSFDHDYPGICEVMEGDANALSREDDAEAVQLSKLNANIISKFESIFQNTNFVGEALNAEIDDLLLRLRLWAADIEADSDTFDLLDNKYPEEAAAVRIYL